MFSAFVCRVIGYLGILIIEVNRLYINAELRERKSNVSIRCLDRVSRCRLLES
ncbi:MAG: hypothetical protein QXY40_04365 [Candidatus Methanomethylicia archaeon]